MKAETYLKQVQKIDAIIQHKMEERERMLAFASNMTARLGAERVQTSGSKQKMADAVVDSVEIGEQIVADINRLLVKRADIIETLEQLDPEEYEVLYKVYVGNVRMGKDGILKTEYSSLKDVASYFCRSYTWGTYLHRKALKSLQRILDEREKPRD